MYGCQNCVTEANPSVQSVDIFFTISCFHSKHYHIGHIPLKNLQKLRYPKSVQNVHLPASELDLTKLPKRGLICRNFHTFHTLNLATFS